MGNCKAIFVALIVTVCNVVGQFSPQYIGTADAIIDQLQGKVPDGAVVNVYRAYGIIEPLDYDGESSIYNPLIMSTQIGAGVDPSINNSGMFSCAINPKLFGASFFVRVINKGFYGESPVYTMDQFSTKPIVIEIENITTPLDTRDSDGDGLYNSWEKTHGTNVDNPDSDNDGFTDHEEICMQTDPNNSNDFLTVYGIDILEEEMIFTWDARGPEYIIEGTTNYLDDTNLVWEIIETNTFGFTVLTNEYDYHIIRVRVDCDQER